MNLAPLPAYDLASLYPNTKVLSSSQVLTYLKDPSEFYRVYHYGQKQESQAMEIGRIFSAAYADRTLDYKPYLAAAGCNQRFIELFEKALAKFPVLNGSQPEYPMIGKIGEWGVRATLDDLHESQGIVIENKTGKKAWNQERVDASPQLTIQWWAYVNQLGTSPKKFLLNWWNTGIVSSPRIETFKVKRTKTQLRDCEDLLSRVIENIEAGNFTNPII